MLPLVLSPAGGPFLPSFSVTLYYLQLVPRHRRGVGSPCEPLGDGRLPGRWPLPPCSSESASRGVARASATPCGRACRAAPGMLPCSWTSGTRSTACPGRPCCRPWPPGHPVYSLPPRVPIGPTGLWSSGARPPTRPRSPLKVGCARGSMRSPALCSGPAGPPDLALWQVRAFAPSFVSGWRAISSVSLCESIIYRKRERREKRPASRKQS
jgi:hypothetical protein